MAAHFKFRRPGLGPGSISPRGRPVGAQWARLVAAAVLLGVALAGCSGIPAFPGTGPPAVTATATPRPQPAIDVAATVEAAVKATQEAAPARVASSPAPATALPVFRLTPPASMAPAAAGLLTAIATVGPGGSGVGRPTEQPAPVGGGGASSPELAVQRAYEAAANGDEQTLRALTDPERGGSGSEIRVVELLGHGSRKPTLLDMQYHALENDGATAIVSVTGSIGQVPVLGERPLNERETVRQIGGLWYLSREGG